MIITFCLFLTVAALSGYYAYINDLKNAIKLFFIQNLVWAIWGFFYLIMMIWFWFRFINIVLENINDLTNQHQTQSSELQNKLDQLRKGTRNVSLNFFFFSFIRKKVFFFYLKILIDFFIERIS